MLRIALFGATGAVGKELTSLLLQRNFPLKELRSFDSKSPIELDGIDIAFFATHKEVAAHYVPLAVAQGIVCIDGSSAFRSDPNVPLIIPEINGSAIASHKGVIASPNCTATLILLPLAPLHRSFGVKRVVAATYQAVSGAGVAAMSELKTQTEDYLAGNERTHSVFPHPIAFNLFLHESPLCSSNYSEEEEKVYFETKKILGEEIEISATCVRVPIFRAHSATLNIELRSDPSLEEVRELIRQAPGVCLLQDSYPMPCTAEQSPLVYCGRVRKDRTQENTFELWLSGDQLLKGAALNMVQIAESLVTLAERRAQVGDGGLGGETGSGCG